VEKTAKENGKFRKETVKTGFPKIDLEKLKTYLAEHPDAYQKEMAQEFGCSESGIRYVLKQQKIMRKKDHPLQGTGSAKGRSISEGN